ncbi:VWA domain-containing protein [Occallatibacter savannae]|uniref:VWA domain-containing protein n=1 Tax=Occallatibacter savannae TaxID=1002691 RepID=UPI000D698251|nr:VWA domain-containing protein [Occallatibacter savannae]
MRIHDALTFVVCLASLSSLNARAQSDTVTVNTDLVQVSALVKSHKGERVYLLKAQDFAVLDNGIAQTIHVEEETGREPIALAIVVQDGGRAASRLKDYQHIETLLEDMIGDVPHTVAVIHFDSTPSLARGFGESIPEAARTIAELEPGDDGAAILDAVAFGIQQLKDVPPRYRRALLLMSETFDKGSQISLGEAVRAVSDTNTTIYSLAFSSTKADAGHRAEKIPRLGGTPYSRTPYAPGGCMSREPGADPDAHGSRAIQAWDCAGDLLPPLRIAELAFMSAKNGLRENVPRTLTRLTGGDYLSFSDEKSLAAGMMTIMNNLPNRYVLTFRPTPLVPGPHALQVKVVGQQKLMVEARTTYWVDERK